MSSICDCTVPTALADIGLGTFENIGLIRRAWFQRKYSGATLNEIDTVANDPTLKATWDALLAAADSTKVVNGPIMEEPATTLGGPIEYEKSNQGKIKLAEGIYTLEMKGVAIDVDTRNAIKALECEAVSPEKLTAFLVNDCGLIWGQSTDKAASDFRGFDIEYISVDYDPSEFAYDSPQKFNVKIEMRAGWSENRVAVSPADFNALEI